MTLYVIGWVYANRANQYIHGRFGGKWWRMKDKAHGTATKAKIAGNVVASVNAARKMQKKQDQAMEGAQWRALCGSKCTKQS